MARKGTSIAVVVVLGLLGACDKTDKDPVLENQAPVAIIKTNTVSGDSPLTVNFDGSFSTDPEEGVLNFLWDFGDGSSSSSAAPTKTYSETGTFTVRLTVTDDGGLSDTKEVVIKVNKAPDLFPVTDKAQWVYRVKSTDTENGKVTGYEEGLTYLVVEDLNLEYEYTDFITLRVTGKKYYNEKLLGNHIYLGHHAGRSLSVTHDGFAPYQDMINLDATSWSDFAMFFSNSSSLSVIQSEVNLTIGMGAYNTYKVKHQRDNWGENYVSERYDISEEEYLAPGLGMIYRKTSRYVDFLDCFTCPVYGGGNEIEMVGYYIKLPDGTVQKGGTGYNADNPYGGELGLLTIWASVDIGYTDVYIEGEFVGTIGNYFSGGASCDHPSALNVFRPYGTYTLTATSSKGWYWEGDVVFIEGTCDLVELEIGKKGRMKGQGIKGTEIVREE